MRLILGRHFADVYDDRSWYSAYKPGIEIGYGDDDGINLLVHVDDAVDDLLHIRVHPTDSGIPPKFFGWGLDRLVVLVDGTVTVIGVPDRAIIAEFQGQIPLYTVFDINRKLMAIGEFQFFLVSEELQMLQSHSFHDRVVKFDFIDDLRLRIQFEDGSDLTLDCT